QSWRYGCLIVRPSNGRCQLGLAKSRPIREQFQGHSIQTPVLKSLWPFWIAYLCSLFIKQRRRSGLPSDPVKRVSAFRSNLGSAAINEQFDTRDETRVIRSQKQRRLSNFLGLPPCVPPEWRTQPPQSRLEIADAPVPHRLA